MVGQKYFRRNHRLPRGKIWVDLVVPGRATDARRNPFLLWSCSTLLAAPLTRSARTLDRNICQGLVPLISVQKSSNKVSITEYGDARGKSGISGTVIRDCRFGRRMFTAENIRFKIDLKTGATRYFAIVYMF